MNLSGMDLNLFQVLHAVLKEKSATRAARRLNVTQSAVSNALARLRTILNDPLVVRAGRGLVPTPRAIELYPLVESAMSQLQLALDQQSGADAAQSARCYTLACSDSSQVHDVCSIVAALSRRMPQASLRIVSVEQLMAGNGLETGEVDALMGARQAGKGFRWTDLYRDEPVLILRRNHPRASGKISRETFNSLQHLDTLVASSERGQARRPYLPFSKSDALERRVVLTVPSFTAAAMVVARSDYAAAMPRRVAAAMREYLPLRIVEFPFPGSTSVVGLIWHARTDADQAARLFRQVIVSAVRG